MWLMAAVGSALFAGVTSILAKLGIRKTDSDVATAIRTIVVLAFSWLMALVTGQVGAIGTLTAKAWAFLALSGVATGASPSTRRPPSSRYFWQSSCLAR